MTDIEELLCKVAHEQTGLWDVVSEIASMKGVGREEAFSLLQEESQFIKSREDLYILFSWGLYDSMSSRKCEKEILTSLTLGEVEFSERGPYYYLSYIEEI